VKVGEDEKVSPASPAEVRADGVAAPYRPLTDGPDAGERHHRHQPTISHLRACQPRTVAPRSLPRRAARSATRRGRRSICRVPSIENREARAACLGVRGRISAILCRSRSRNQSSEFESTDPIRERSDVLRLGISFNAFRNSKRVLRGSASLRQLLTKPFPPRRKRLKTSTVTQSPHSGARGDTAGMRQKRTGEHRL